MFTVIIIIGYYCIFVITIYIRLQYGLILFVTTINTIIIAINLL